MTHAIRTAVGAAAALLATALLCPEARADGTGGVAPPVYPPSTYESKSWTTPAAPGPSWRPGDPATTPDPRSSTAALPAWVDVARDPAALGATAAASCAPAPTALDCGWGFEAWARYWRVRPSGTTFITKGGEPGSATTIDLRSDLETDDGDGWQAGVAVRYGRHRGFLSYEALSFSGSAVLDDPVVFHFVTYPRGEHVDSTLDLDVVRLGYDYAWKHTPTFLSRVGISGWLWNFDQSLKGTTSGLDESRGFSHVLPVLHASAEAMLGWAHLGARAAGGLLASDRYAIDLEATAGVRLGRAVTLDVGYRWMKFVFHETTNEADMTFQGPLVALTVVF